MNKLVISLCLSALITTSAAAATDAVAAVKRYRDIQLGRSATVSAFSVKVGHMTVELASGTATVVLAGDEPVGLFLHGEGRFNYVTDHKDELSALKYNAKHGGVAAQVDGTTGSISEGVKSVLLLGDGLPGVEGAVAEAPVRAFQENRALFDRQHFNEPPEFLLVLRTANAPGARVVHADIQGSERPYVYKYDAAWHGAETLTSLRPPSWRTRKDANWLYPTVLSRQAVGRSNRTFAPPNVILTALDVTLVNTSGDDATLTIEETLVPQRRAAQALLFDLYSDYIFDVDRAPRKYNVRRITDGKGNALSFHHEKGRLLVGLAEAAAANKPLKLRFEIDGEILYRPEGSNYWELGIEPWFPSLEWSEHAFTYHALLKVRKPFTAFTSGTTVRREVEGEWNVIETRLEQPVSFIAILAGRYHFDEETRDGVTVRVGSFLVKNEAAWKKLRSIAFAAIESYPRFLGPFPFNEINILERNDFGYGQAPAGIVFITKEAFTPMLGEANDWVKGINLRLAHELAHMYWGSAVRMPSPEEQWIDEAFAEYSAAMFFKLAGRPQFYDQAVMEWRTGAKESTRVTIIPMANRLVNPGDAYGNAVLRQGLIYSKGAYLLAALHQELGDNMFLTFLKSYQKSFRGKLATTEDVMGLLQFLTKKDYAPFFEQYFYGTDLPELRKR